MLKYNIIKILIAFFMECINILKGSGFRTVLSMVTFSGDMALKHMGP
jgi:hypothetical protein